MRPIARTLGEARFVHLIRDGRDVALSRLRRGMGEDKPIADVAELWRRRIENARRQARRLRGRYLELRYEDLVAEPEPALRRVCELDRARVRARRCSATTSAPPSVWPSSATSRPRAGGARVTAASARPRTRSRRGRRPSARTEVWRTEMSGPDRAAFEAVAGGLLTELGYDVPS